MNNCILFYTGKDDQDCKEARDNLGIEDHDEENIIIGKKNHINNRIANTAL